MAVTITLWTLLIGLIGAFVWMRWRAGRDDQSAAPNPRPTAPSSGKSQRESADAAGQPAASPSEPESPSSNTAGSSLQADADSLFAGGASASRKPASTTPNSTPTNTRPSNDATPDAAPKARPGAKRHWMVGVTKDLKDKAFHIGEKTATIGRLPNNLIQIDSGNASRVHCQLRGSAQHVQVMPMDAKNGTRINGELAEPHKLHALSDGDVLEIGNSVLVYREYVDEDDDQTEGKKQRGVSVEAATALVGGQAWSERLRNELSAHGGDIPETARSMGIESDVLEHMIAQLGLDAG